MARRANGEGLIRQRVDGLWEWRGTLPDGKRKSLYGKTRSEVVEKYRRAQRDLAAGRDLTAKRQTMDQYLRHWLHEVKRPAIRTATFESYEGLIRVHIAPELGRVKLDELTPQQVQSFLNAKSQSGLSASRVRHLRGLLRSALNHAIRTGLVTRNVAQLAEPPRLIRHEVTPLTPAQTRQFLTVADRDRLGPLFRVAILTGLRQGELLGLRWEDVDLDGGSLRVRYAMRRGELVEPKTSKSRRALALPASAVAAIREQRDRQAFERRAAGDRWTDRGLVFTSTVGTPLNPSNVTHRLQAILEKHGLPRQRFHDLRHLCATLLLLHGVPMRAVMEQLGHSQIGLTMNTYAHVLPELMQANAAALDAALGEERVG